jgi:hypothetical protein
MLTDSFVWKDIGEGTYIPKDRTEKLLIKIPKKGDHSM